jgi:hypothetical protein
MKQARARLRHEAKLRERPARRWGSGLTIFNVHFTRGVILGAVALVGGLCMLAWLGFAYSSGMRGRAIGRVFGVTLVVTGFGAVMLYRALVLGEED